MQNLIPGRGFLHSITSVLTDDQIKALPTQPVELFEYLGPDRLCIPVQLVGIVNTEAGAYTNIKSPCVLAFSELNIQPFNEEDQGVLASQALSIIYFNPTSLIYNGQSYDFASGAVVSNINNSRPYITAYNNFENFTGGNSANSITLNLVYMIYDLAKDQFI